MGLAVVELDINREAAVAEPGTGNARSCRWCGFAKRATICRVRVPEIIESVTQANTRITGDLWVAGTQILTDVIPIYPIHRLPVPLGRQILLHEARLTRQRGGTTKEESTDHGIGVAGTGIRDLEGDPASNVPDKVRASMKARHRAGIKHYAHDIIDHFNRLGSNGATPVESLEGNLMGLSILDLNVYGEVISVVPGSRNPVT